MPETRAFTVLFVCTGNTCRSPMAEAMLRARLPAGWRERVQVFSAGTAAVADLPASSNTLEVLERGGVPLEGHRSRQFTRAMAEEADLVLALTAEHRGEILAAAPAAADRTFVLSTYLAGPGGADELVVHDPMGGSLETYEEAYRRIGAHLDRVLPGILERVGAPRE